MRDGQFFAFGFFSAAGVLSLVAAATVAGAAFNTLPFGRDATDPAGSRSGLRLLTDAATGCQYLSAGAGGLTPRLDGAGLHVCGVAK